MDCRVRSVRPFRSRLATSASVVALTACGAVNTRPYLTPLPGALVDTIPVAPSVAVQQLVAQVSAEGIAIQVAAPEEGFLETRWHKLAPDGHEPVHTGDSRSTVRLRFFADPIGENLTQLTSEAVTRGQLDPSLAERARERLVAFDHPGNDLVRRIVAAVEAALGAARP